MTSISSLTSYTLAPLDDQLYLLGTANINGTGNIKANAIFGNIADNILDRLKNQVQHSAKVSPWTHTTTSFAQKNAPASCR